MKKVVFNIITFLCIAACSSNKEQDNLITIHLDPTSRQTVNWEQLFDTASMQVIPLETIDQSLLAWVDKVIITDTVYSLSLIHISPSPYCTGRWSIVKVVIYIQTY